MAQVSIPFDGFYSSIHDSNLDYWLDQMFSDESGNPFHGLVSRAYNAMNWRAVHTAYAKSYAGVFANKFGIKGLQFSELDSPREYNFTTDRIFVEIPDAELNRIKRELEPEALEAEAREWFTSRSGFISFYSNDPDEWGVEWDANQWACLLSAWVKAHDEYTDDWQTYGMDDANCNGEAEEMFCDALPSAVLTRLFKVCDYLRQRGELNMKSSITRMREERFAS